MLPLIDREAERRLPWTNVIIKLCLRYKLSWHVTIDLLWYIPVILPHECLLHEMIYSWRIFKPSLQHTKSTQALGTPDQDLTAPVGDNTKTFLACGNRRRRHYQDSSSTADKSSATRDSNPEHCRAVQDFMSVIPNTATLTSSNNIHVLNASRKIVAFIVIPIEYSRRLVFLVCLVGN
jgi:hypothetical protein